jgi:hypothetical protein
MEREDQEPTDEGSPMIALEILVSSWVLWVIFAAMMRLRQVRDAGKLTLAMKVLGYPVLFFGLFIDFMLNAVPGSILFLEFPREMTLSKRLWRHSQESTGYKQKLAELIRVNLLDALDPSGVHRG